MGRRVAFLAALLIAASVAGPGRAACPRDLENLKAQLRDALLTSDDPAGLSSAELVEVMALREISDRLQREGKTDECALVVDRARAILQSVERPQIMLADSLVGREIGNREGEDLGRINGLILDPLSGKIAYAVVEFGGLLGLGGDLVPVPWGAVRDVASEERVIMEVASAQLENAPRFDPENWAEAADRGWGLSVHRYFDIEPYWSNTSRIAQGSAGLAALRRLIADRAGRAADESASTLGGKADGFSAVSGGSEASPAPRPAEERPTEALSESLADKVDQLARSVSEMRSDMKSLMEPRPMKATARHDPGSDFDESLRRLGLTLDRLERRVADLADRPPAGTVKDPSEDGSGDSSSDAAAEPGAAERSDRQSQTGQGSAASDSSGVAERDRQQALAGGGGRTPESDRSCASRIEALERGLGDAKVVKGDHELLAGLSPAEAGAPRENWMGMPPAKKTIRNQLRIATALAEEGNEAGCQALVERVRDQLGRDAEAPARDQAPGAGDADN